VITREEEESTARAIICPPCAGQSALSQLELEGAHFRWAGRRIRPGSPARVQESGSHRRSAGKATQARVCQCFMFKVSVRNPYKGLSTVATAVAIDSR